MSLGARLTGGGDFGFGGGGYGFCTGFFSGTFFLGGG